MGWMTGEDQNAIDKLLANATTRCARVGRDPDKAARRSRQEDGLTCRRYDDGTGLRCVCQPACQVMRPFGQEMGVKRGYAVTQEACRYESKTIDDEGRRKMMTI
jgi:hypothetical protein